MDIKLSYEVETKKVVFIAKAYDDNETPQLQEVIESAKDEYILDALKMLEKKLRKRLMDKICKENSR